MHLLGNKLKKNKSIKRGEGMIEMNNIYPWKTESYWEKYRPFFYYFNTLYIYGGMATEEKIQNEGEGGK